jgi:spore germination cell wall hydrolase CwlJ-like protein
VLQRFNGQQMRGIVATLLVSLLGAGFTAHAGLTSYAAETAQPPKAVARGYEADDHFPGAALFNVAEEGTAPAAPAAGTTGTTELPDTPVPEGAVIDTSIRPAAAFRLAGSATDKARALQCLTTAIYYEAANEPDDGQRAVAQVILNRARHPAFPASVCGVVYQGSEKRGCQFSFACDGSMARVPSQTAWARSARAAARALSGDVFAPVGLATHYHTYAVTPSWNRSLVMTGTFGAHFFHRWKGWWGTPAAFHQRYAGGEPLPGPHPRIDQPAPTALAGVTPIVPIPGQPVAAPPTPRAAIQSAYADSGTPQPKYAGTVLPESTILDRWKDTGKPLR